MGNNLVKWAVRLGEPYSLTPIARHVLTVMANSAADYGVKDKDGNELTPALYKRSRAALAKEIYGDGSKARNLNRPMKELKDKGLITPIGSRAHSGYARDYRLCIAEAITMQSILLQQTYPEDSAEIGRYLRRA